MCRVQASRGFPPHARRSFFERVHGLSILLVGLRPGAHMREAQCLKSAIDHVVRHRESELLIQPHDEIARPPAHHAMDRRDRTLLYDSGEKGLVPGVELGRHSRRRDTDETVLSLLVEPDFTVGFIGHIKLDRGWSLITLVGRFVPWLDLLPCAKYLFVAAIIVVIAPISCSSSKLTRASPLRVRVPALRE